MFRDRFDAAKQLVKKLEKYKNNPDVIVLAVPRGGVQTGYVLAKDLNVKLEIVLTKKIGYPGNPEYAIGAVSLTGEIIEPGINKEVSKEYIKTEINKIRTMLKEKYKKYHGEKERMSLKDKIIIITDDGVATGKTLLATIELVKKEKPKKIVIAVPVGPPDTIEMFKLNVDEVVCLLTPGSFFAIGEFYENFSQVEDAEAIKLLNEVQ